MATTDSLARGLAVLLATIALACGADAQRAERVESLREMFDLLGLTNSAAQWRQIAKSNMQQFEEAFDAARMEQVQQAALEAYETEPMIEEIVESFMENYDEDAVRALVRYYRSPEGEAIIKASVIVSDPLGTMDSFVAGLAERPPTNERVALAERLAQATRQSEQTVTIMVGVSKTNLRAVEPLLPGPVSEAVLAAREVEIREALLERVEQHVTLTNLYSFRDLSDEALRNHLEFVESGYFSWYLDQLEPAVQRALLLAGSELSKRIAGMADAAGE